MPTIVDNRFNSLDIVSEEKLILSFGIRPTTVTRHPPVENHSLRRDWVLIVAVFTNNESNSEMDVDVDVDLSPSRIQITVVIVVVAITDRI